MKTFRLLGMALIAILVSVNFASCSSDDEEDDGGGTVVSGKLLKSITEKDGYSTYTSTFTYNANKQLVSATSGYDGEYINAAWSDNSVIVETTSPYFEEEPATFSLKNGIVTSTSQKGSQTVSLTYDSNRLTKINGCTWSWANGNISKFSYQDGGEALTYTCTYYTDKENKHPVVDINALKLYYVSGMEWGELLLKAHPNLLGATNKNLLKSITSNNGRMSRNFTYELDSDGYPTKITEELDEKGTGDFDTTTYTLTWE